MFLLIPISFVAVYLNFLLRSGKIIRSLVNSWLLITLFVMLQTELFSLFKIWTSLTVAISWLALLLIGSMFIYSGVFRTGCIGEKKIILEKLKEYRIWLVLFLIFYSIIIFIAILSGQSNIDSLIYHLSRIMHWIQNKSVGHYATSADKQIRYPVLAEYLVSQIYLLGASDRLANMVQTCAYMSSAVLIFGISRRIGASVKFSFFASLLYILMPMAMAQAFTTQTDNIAGLFLLIFIYVLLDFIQADRLGSGEGIVKKGIQLAASVAFGYLCKPTVCFTMAVYFAWMCFIRLYKKDNITVLLKYILVGTLTVFILFSPLLFRSYKTYMEEDVVTITDESTALSNGNVILSDVPAAIMKSEVDNISSINSPVNTIAPDSANVVSALKDPIVFLMNCLQNMGRNVASNSFPLWNELILKVVNKVGGFLNYDVSGFSVQKEKGYFDCDTASNPVITCLGALAFICVLLNISKVTREQKFYTVCAFASFVLQCGLMGYTGFRTRYLVGILAVMCPSVAIFFDNFQVKKYMKENIALVFIVVACFGGINTFSCEIGHVSNSLRGYALHQYFKTNYKEYTHCQTIQYINEAGYTNIGIAGNFSYEYVLWRGIRNLERMESVNVQVASLKKYEDESFIPECIVEETQEPEETVKRGEQLQCHGMIYECVWTMYGNTCHYSIYVPVTGQF